MRDRPAASGLQRGPIETLGGVICLLVFSTAGHAAEASPPTSVGPLAPAEAVLSEQLRREQTIQKIRPATIAVFDRAGEGGGSGVVISPDGYAVTNFHVVAPCGATMHCGLPDGRLVDAVLVGLDPVGDIAVIRLLGDAGAAGADWPYAEWGDSDQVRVGDEALVAGNPFLLASDFQPTVTRGVISGVHRYQYPAGTLLEYADCLQTDASINPGNSGGPLYDGRGRLIGINGRASFEKRGRVNVGVGYAVSANQVRRFLSLLQAGRIVDHASLGATVRTAASGRVVVDQIREDSDAYRRGLRYGDEVVRFADREIHSANALQNALGTHPPGWRASLTIRRGYETRRLSVRLGRVHGAAQLETLVAEQMKLSREPGDAYEWRPGFANYHFNHQQRDAVLRECPQQGGVFQRTAWRIEGEAIGGGPLSIRVGGERVDFVSQRGRFWADVQGPLDDQLGPPGSGGLLALLHLCRLALSDEPPEGLHAWGELPWSAGRDPGATLSISVAGIAAEFAFDPDTGDLIGAELIGGGREPCRVEFGDFRLGAEGKMPARMVVSRGDVPWIEAEFTEFSRVAAPSTEAGSTFNAAPDEESVP